MAFDHFAPRLRSAPFVGYSANPELDAARNDDRQDFFAQQADEHDAAVEREEARLEALARAEAAAGNFDKLWTAVDYGDNDREVMAALLACARGEPGAQQAAQMVVTLLAKTYATHHAEVHA